MSKVRVIVNGHPLTVAAGTTLEELAEKLWVGASLEVGQFIVDGAFVDRIEWPSRVVLDRSDISAWQAGVYEESKAPDD